MAPARNAVDSTQKEIVLQAGPKNRYFVSILIISVDTFYYTQMRRMATLAVQARIPIIGPLGEFAAEGGLLSYDHTPPVMSHL